MYKADSNLVYPGFNGRWRCDRCSRSFIPQMNNVPFHCSQCEFDLCDSCMKTTGHVSNGGKISIYSTVWIITVGSRLFAKQKHRMADQFHLHGHFDRLNKIDNVHLKVAYVKSTV